MGLVALLSKLIFSCLSSNLTALLSGSALDARCSIVPSLYHVSIYSLLNEQNMLKLEPISLGITGQTLLHWRVLLRPSVTITTKWE